MGTDCTLIVPSLDPHQREHRLPRIYALQDALLAMQTEALDGTVECISGSGATNADGYGCALRTVRANRLSPLILEWLGRASQVTKAIEGLPPDTPVVLFWH